MVELKNGVHMSGEDSEEINRAVAEFTKIPGVGLSKAKKLYEMGYRTLDDLRKASVEELASIKGIGEGRAILIRRYFDEGAEKREEGRKEEMELHSAENVKKEVAGSEEKMEEPQKKVSDTERVIEEMEKELEEAEKVLETTKGKEAKIVFEKKPVRKEGKINGLKTKPVKPGKRERVPNLRMASAVFLALILVFTSIFVLWYALQPSGRIMVDGNIEDWEGIAKYTDSIPVFNQDINLNEYGVYYENDRVYFYGRVSGSLFNGANGGFDALVIFVDADGNPNTGYRIENLGVDAKIEVTGYGGEIRSASVSRFIPDSASAKPEL
ncbi:MAG: helix-hairpin-helix domain-containing protein, partial [Thermoplasmata archaeon]|nr:helix-hairpin-helix domain-containing protein [Thermoplasmata archaeon]